ncbi:MAG: nucleotidyltransferase domain-containing protein [Nitrososphaerota archaeon]
MLREKLKLILDRNPQLRELEEVLLHLFSSIDSNDVLAIVLGGSIARDRFVYGMSDIDVLVVKEAGSPEFKLFSIGDVDVEVTILGVDDVVYAFRSGNSFVIDALENGLILKGEEFVKQFIESFI